MYLANLYASADKLGPSFGDVIHNQVQTSHAARLSCVHIQPGPKANRTVGPFWGQLNNPDALAWLHVNVLDESELAGIEGNGTVNVRHGERDQLKLHLHRSRALLRSSCPTGSSHAIGDPTDCHRVSRSTSSRSADQHHPRIASWMTTCCVRISSGCGKHAPMSTGSCWTIPRRASHQPRT